MTTAALLFLVGLVLGWIGACFWLDVLTFFDTWRDEL